MKADPQKNREWQQRGAQRYAEKTQARPRAPRKPKKQRNDAAWRNECIARYGAWCRACGTSRDVQMDHMLPRSQGGASDVRNGLPLCRTHHEAKTAGTLKIRPEWLDEAQKAFLAEAGWVDWDSDGEPFGRGWKHFTAKGREEEGRVAG